MFTLPGLLGLIAYILARPFDFVPALRVIPFLYIFFGLAVLGFFLDLGQGKVKWKAGIHLPWVIALVVWALFTNLIRAPDTLQQNATNLLIPVSLYFLIAHGVTTFKHLAWFASVVLACTLCVAVVCIHQGFQPFQCVAYAPDDPPDSIPRAEGRSCADPGDCYDTMGDPELRYACERVGLGGVSTLEHGRVRYLGVLHDPNESALAVSIGIPIAIARYQRRRSWPRLLTMCLSVLLAGATVLMTQSRGGQVVCLTVLGVYFLSRYRWKGLWLALIVSLPILLYGGRSGGGAQESTDERLGCIAAGIKMFSAYPLLGVGHGQYTVFHGQTAHNSYILTPAELGLFGMTAWAMLVWVSIKACLGSFRPSSVGQDNEARTWGFALLASLVGIAIGALFLTFNYHYVFWTLFGMAGAYHNIVSRQAKPDSQPLRIGPRDVALVAAANLALIGFFFVYTRMKGIG